MISSKPQTIIRETGSELYRTRTGIVIGAAWTAPPPRPGHGMEAVQRWLLTQAPTRAHKPRTGGWWVGWGLGVCVALVGFAGGLLWG